MKKEEQIVQEYLHTISRDVVYEPDGKIPPDFVLNRRIAVEVRRLNQNIIREGRSNGIEQDRIKLLHALSKVFGEFDASNPSHNYWIVLEFFRPIGQIAEIKRRARAELVNFLKNKPYTPYEIKLAKRVSITVVKRNRKSNKVFIFGIESDKDGGGFVAPLYIDNINFCIAEKTTKIQKYKARYSEWWLVLVDFLVGGIGEPEKTIAVRNINKGADWKKIIVINPLTNEEILRIS